MIMTHFVANDLIIVVLSLWKRLRKCGFPERVLVLLQISNFIVDFSHLYRVPNLRIKKNKQSVIRILQSRPREWPQPEDSNIYIYIYIYEYIRIYTKGLTETRQGR